MSATARMPAPNHGFYFSRESGRCKPNDIEEETLAERLQRDDSIGELYEFIFPPFMNAGSLLLKKDYTSTTP